MGDDARSFAIGRIGSTWDSNSNCFGVLGACVSLIPFPFFLFVDLMMMKGGPPHALLPPPFVDDPTAALDLFSRLFPALERHAARGMQFRDDAAFQFQLFNPSPQLLLL